MRGFSFFKLMSFLTFLTPFLLNGMSLDEYLDIVKEGNVSIKSAAVAKDRARLSYYQSFSGYFPSVDVGTSFYYDQATEDVLNAPGADLDTSLASKRNPLWTRSLKVSLPIFTGGSRLFGNFIADKNDEIAEIELNYERANVEATAVSAFFEAFITQENIKTTELSIKAASENLRTAKLQLDSGKTTRLAYLNFELAYKKRLQELEDYRMTFKKNAARMSMVAGRAVSFDVLEGGDFSSTERVFSSQGADEVFDSEKQVMLDNSPLLARSNRLKFIAEYKKYIALGALFPTLSFNYTHDFGPAENHPFESTYLDSDDSVTVSLNWNVFNGFSDVLEWRKAAADLVGSELAFTDLLNTQLYNLKSVVVSIYSLLEQKRVAEASLDVAKSAMEQSRLEYESGKALYLDLLNAENNYYDALKNMTFIENSIYNSFFQLKLITGSGEIR